MFLQLVMELELLGLVYIEYTHHFWIVFKDIANKFAAEGASAAGYEDVFVLQEIVVHITVHHIVFLALI